MSRNIEFIETARQIDFFEIKEAKDKSKISVYDLVRSPLRRSLSFEEKEVPKIKYLFKSILKELLPSRIYSVFFEGFEIIFSVNIINEESFFNFEFIREQALINERLGFYEREVQVIRYFLEKEIYKRSFSQFGNIFFIVDYRFKDSIYPSPILKITYDPDPEIESYIRRRIELHKEGTFCSDEDMMIRRQKDGRVLPYGCLFLCPVKNICKQAKIFVLNLDK